MLALNEINWGNRIFRSEGFRKLKGISNNLLYPFLY